MPVMDLLISSVRCGGSQGKISVLLGEFKDTVRRNSEQAIDSHIWRD